VPRGREPCLHCAGPTSTIFASTVPHPEIVNPRDAINTHPLPELQEAPFGYRTAAVYGYTHVRRTRGFARRDTVRVFTWRQRRRC